jgi:glycosyltransferase involved in cell wall biosynthesis
MSLPLVSVIVPAYNEHAWIAGCLAAIGAQQYPHDHIEVLVVVDGDTTDDTAERARRLLEAGRYKNARVLRNPGNGTPSNLNHGLDAATGELVCRVDSRSVIAPDYVERCVEVLRTRPDVIVVGGTPVAIAGSGSDQAMGVARAFNNRYAMGWSRHHRGAKSGPSDTVYLGAFRTSELRAAGGWNVDFPTNQDFELNRRLSRSGTVWFDSGMEVGYVTRTSARALFRHYVRFGRWKVRYWRVTGDRPRPRQVVMLVGPPCALVVGGSVLVAASPRARAALIAGAGLAAMTIEMSGSRRPRGSPSVHAWSLVALGAAVSGWLAGVWRELAAR